MMCAGAVNIYHSVSEPTNSAIIAYGTGLPPMRVTVSIVKIALSKLTDGVAKCASSPRSRSIVEPEDMDYQGNE